MPLSEATPVVHAPVPAAAAPVRGALLDGLSALGVALLPKCPMCLMAYASMFGGLGVERLPLGKVWPAAVALLAVSLMLTAYRAWRRQRLQRFLLALLGAGVLVAARSLDAPQPVALAGLVLLVGGLLWTRRGLRPRAAAH